MLASKGTLTLYHPEGHDHFDQEHDEGEVEEGEVGAAGEIHEEVHHEGGSGESELQHDEGTQPENGCKHHSCKKGQM